jgi:hypothetical protein
MLLLRLLCDALALLVLLGGVGDGKTYASGQLAVAILMIMLRGVGGRFAHTRGKRLLELLGLVLILEDEGVEVTVAADLELDLLGRGLLDTGSCLDIPILVLAFLLFAIWSLWGTRKNTQEASLRRQISMNCLISVTWEGMLAVLRDVWYGVTGQRGQDGELSFLWVARLSELFRC